MLLDRTRILQSDEIAAVITDCTKKMKRSPTLEVNLIVFRLSCQFGLRRKEIAGLQMRDVILFGPRPHIVIRKDNTKGGEGKRRKRQVPLWWDAEPNFPKQSLAAWFDKRMAAGASGKDPFVCSMRKGFYGNPICWNKVPCHWRTAIRCLGPERGEQLSIHQGRHSFISHSLAKGRSLGEVRDAVGHSSIAVTDIYVHAIETEGLPSVFNC